MDERRIEAVRAALDAMRDTQARADAALKALEEQDLSRENALLREKLGQLEARLAKNAEETAALREAHEALTRDFKHELASKRLALLGLSERQHQKYLNAGLANERGRIDKLYSKLLNDVDGIIGELSALDAGESAPLADEARDLRGRVLKQAALARARAEAEWSAAANRHNQALHKIGNSPIEDAALNTVRQFFQWEAFLGLKIISAVGALLILLGVFTFGRYLYVHMSPAIQCAVIFALGLAFMGAGEAFYLKKWRGGFALALTAGGSGVLFLGAALGYMTLHVLPMGAALGVCAGVSLLSFAAALRYNAQLVAVFALIGGYLPIFALSGPILLYAAVYFTILSLFALLISTRKNWRVARFFGLFAGLLAETALLELISDSHYAHGEAIAAVGALIGVAFAAYLVIPVFGAWFTKTRIIAADIVLLSCNVFFQYLIGLYWVYALYEHFGWLGSHGSAFVTGFVAVCCIAMALAAERQKFSGVPESEAGSLRALFFITSVAFAALVVLFAADRVWFSGGWLVEAAGLSLYGIFKDRRRFITAGIVVGAFCLFAFLLFNVTDRENPLFVWQYLSVTLAAAAVGAATLRRKPVRPGVIGLLNAFRCAAAFNVWGFVVYALFNPLWPTLSRIFAGSAGSFAALLSIALGFLFAFALPRIKRAYNYGFQAAAISVGAVSSLWMHWFNAGSHDLAHGGAAMGAAAFALYIIVNITTVGWVNDLLRFLMGLRKLPLRLYPALISGFAVLLAAQNLVVQLSLKPSSLILTLLFGLTALGWVLFGFLRRNGITRIGGLALAFFAVIKLFVLDLAGLTTTWRVVSYITGGAVLLAISFAYQWFSKRLEYGGEKLGPKPEQDIGKTPDGPG